MNSTLVLKTFTLQPKEDKIIDDYEFLVNDKSLIKMEQQRYINIFPIQEKVEEVEQEVTPSTSKPKRGRKSKKGEN